jgi:hypothetical protein
MRHLSARASGTFGHTETRANVQSSSVRFASGLVCFPFLNVHNLLDGPHAQRKSKNLSNGIQRPGGNLFRSNMKSEPMTDPNKWRMFICTGGILSIDGADNRPHVFIPHIFVWGVLVFCCVAFGRLPSELSFSHTT